MRTRPPDPPAAPATAAPGAVDPLRLSDQLEEWLTGGASRTDGASKTSAADVTGGANQTGGADETAGGADQTAGPERTLGSLVHAFGDKSFAILLVLLLAIPALPLPTGGVTHVFELIALLIALELIAGRHEVWLPERWRSRELAGPGQARFITRLMTLIRRLERYSRPRLRFVFRRRFTDIAFGVVVIAGTAGAFLAPPFSGLDTLPALGVVVLSLGVLLEDALIALVGILFVGAGIALELALGAAAVHGISSIL